MEKTEKKYVELTHSFTDMWADNQETTLTFRFSKPNRADITRFQTTAQKNNTNAMRELLLSIIHEEDKQKFLDALEEYPGIVISFINPILSSIGVSADLGKQN